MTDVITTYKALRAAEAHAEEIVAAARQEFGRALYEARTRPPHLGRISRKDIERDPEIELGYERLRQIEEIYLKTLTAAS